MDDSPADDAADDADADAVRPASPLTSHGFAAGFAAAADEQEDSRGGAGALAGEPSRRVRRGCRGEGDRGTPPARRGAGRDGARAVEARFLAKGDADARVDAEWRADAAEARLRTAEDKLARAESTAAQAESRANEAESRANEAESRGVRTGEVEGRRGARRRL